MRIRLSISFVVGLILIICVLPFFINGTGRYTVRDGKAFYGDDEVLGINMAQYKSLSWDVVKDSSTVFFKGEPVDWVDAPSFVSLNNDIFADKNSLYCVNNGLYAIHSLRRMKKSYDKETFKNIGDQYIGGLLYKDKNGLYICKNSPNSIFGSYSNPLKKLKLNGIDTSTLVPVGDQQMTMLHWYRDAKRLYFGKYGSLELCDDIDAATFEPITYRLFRDNKNVYYMKNYMRTKEGKVTSSPEYAILEGADAETFRQIKKKKNNLAIEGVQEVYEDKNARWEIKRFPIRQGRKKTIVRYDDIILRTPK